MPLRKSKKADLRSTYGLFVEVSLVTALLLLILAFRTNIQSENGMGFTPPPQEVIPFDEMPITVDILKPPPPPRPPVPVEVSNDVIIEDDSLIINPFIEIGELLLPGKLPPIPDGEKKEVAEPDTFVIVEVMPKLIGGLAEIGKKIRYPEIARRAGVEGRVIIQFIVDENGKVTEPAVVRGIGAGCDEEALRVVREARFKPGKQRGKPVKVKMSLPIAFKLK